MKSVANPTRDTGAAAWVAARRAVARRLPLGHWWDSAKRRLAARGDLQVTTDVLRDANPQRYLDPAVIMRFGQSSLLLARRVVEGFISGLHRSPFHGFSVEFADHREYVPGDDIKFIDWMLFARTDHYYIKRSEEETNVRCFILLDRSASMAFGTRGLTKWDYACFLSTCLAYLMLKQQDAVGLALFSSQPDLIVPPRCRSLHLHQIMRAMIRHPPAGPSNVAGSLQTLIQRLKRRSLVVIISDLIDDPAETLKAIRLVGTHQHDVVVFHVHDAAELEFGFEGAALFRDLETGEELEVDPASIRASYLEKVRELAEFYRGGLSEAGIDYEPIDTRQPYDLALGAYLRRRAALRG
ncbi:MAG: DUF58 domain-containing protein [Kiritimatiellia bacterium]